VESRPEILHFHYSTKPFQKQHPFQGKIKFFRKLDRYGKKGSAALALPGWELC